MTLTARAASLADAEAIAAIYNEGIADRIGTFETEPRSAEQIAAWFDGRHPIVVVEEGREVVAFASTSAYRAPPVLRRHRGILGLCRAQPPRRGRRARCDGRRCSRRQTAAGYLEIAVAHFPREHGEPRSDGETRLSRSRHLSAARQARWRLAGLRDRRAPARRGGRVIMRRSVVVSTLGITQTLAWGSTYYLAAVFADPISDNAAAAAGLVLRHFLGGASAVGASRPTRRPHDR